MKNVSERSLRREPAKVRDAATVKAQEKIPRRERRAAAKKAKTKFVGVLSASAGYFNRHVRRGFGAQHKRVLAVYRTGRWVRDWGVAMKQFTGPDTLTRGAFGTSVISDVEGPGHTGWWNVRGAADNTDKWMISHGWSPNA